MLTGARLPAPVKIDFFINKILLLFGSRKQLGKAVIKVSVEHKKSHILQHDRNTLLKFFLLLSFTNIFNLVLYSLFFPYLQNIHSNAPNFKPKPYCQSFFTSQIEPSHQNNLDTTKNRGRKVAIKAKRERGGQWLLVMVVAQVSTTTRNSGGAQGFGHG